MPNYMPYDESLVTELGAPAVGLRALIVEPTNSIRIWDGGDRRYSSMSWETYALCSYVWGRVRSILLLAVWLLVYEYRLDSNLHWITLNPVLL